MQKILKPILIIAMSVLTCLMPMLGYYTIGESWYGALCQMKGVPLVTLPLMMYTIFINGGFMVAVK